MAYNNFKQELWSAHIQRAIEQECLIATGCDYQFEGEIKRGGRVKILGVARPTVNDYTGATLTAENVADTSINLDIEKAKATFFKVDDIDKAQSQEGLMAALMAESAQALAESRDSYVSGLAANAVNISASLSCDTAAEALAAVDAAFVSLWGKGVRVKNGSLELIAPPWFYSNLRSAIAGLDTDNSELLKSGVVGMYNGANIKVSNLLYNDGTDDYIILRTPKAIAFAGALDNVEQTRLTATGVLADAIASLDVYGAKIVRQNEIYVIKAHNS